MRRRGLGRIFRRRVGSATGVDGRQTTSGTTSSRQRLGIGSRRPEEHGLKETLPLIPLLATLALQPACRHGAPPPRPPPEGGTAPVVQKAVPIVGGWIGPLEGSVNADIRPKVEGYLMRQFYKEGQFVRTGESLFEIDPRQFRAALEQAQGTL